MKYADVIIDISHERVDRPFTYRIPDEFEDSVAVGSAVSVPFGRTDRQRRGYVTDIRDTCELDESRIKDILGPAGNELPAEAVLMKLAAWMKREYGSTMITALKTVLPASTRVRSRKRDLQPDPSYTEPENAELKLSDEQRAVVDRIISDHDAGIRGTYLLCGITGSGKTEVYIKCIEEMVKRGRQAIVLIPEIALTWQTLRRFERHFGDRVSVMNSTLSKGEKFDHFELARNGGIDVILGPRSALFAPFPNTGLIIIDEEHEGSYKSESMPKYHARETAEKLAELVPGGASVLLGSATPSMDSLYRAKTGAYTLFRLTKRLTGGTLPDVEIVDMREELRRGNRTPFSTALTERIRAGLERKEQSMIFINRRGMAGFVSCRSCGHVFKCPRCDVSLSSHRGKRLVCHYCGHEEEQPSVCPLCGSKYVAGFRAGTEAVEIWMKKLFPEIRTIRMDADTTSKKGSYDRILRSFAAGEADVLIGTQMIVKGHDFPNVTLVGALAADLSLNTGDYRAAERTFQLLVQAAGRAGRGTAPGHVVIQTYQPEHYAVRHAATQDVDAFYAEEMRFRTLMHYPPAGHLLAVQIFSGDADQGMDFAGRLKTVFSDMTAGDRSVSIMGPTPAAVGRIADVWRFAIYLKSDDRDRLVAMKDRAESELEHDRQQGLYGRIMMQFDFDPVRGF